METLLLTAKVRFISQATLRQNKNISTGFLKPIYKKMEV